jgi:hypothetical protein
MTNAPSINVLTGLDHPPPVDIAPRNDHMTDAARHPLFVSIAMNEQPAPDHQVSEQQRAIRRARHKVAALKGLYIHASIYVVVILGLVLINWLIGDDWWVQWVVIGWGIGVASHAVAVYWDASDRVARWEERKVQELLRQSKRGPG